ncbi:MAG: hypothetical protein HeimC2_32870, partial [Candidatus Heimdallarchaeota archaeon LC_2]
MNIGLRKLFYATFIMQLPSAL